MQVSVLMSLWQSLELVLQNINKLNRSLEGVIAVWDEHEVLEISIKADTRIPGQVGNEFSAVEALWSHFENVMAKEGEPEDNDKTIVGSQSLETPAKDHENTT